MDRDQSGELSGPKSAALHILPVNNLLVALESTREFRDLISAVSMVSTSTFNQRDFGLSLEAAMISLGGSRLFHLGW